MLMRSAQAAGKMGCISRRCFSSARTLATRASAILAASQSP